jgi:Flp pilus assembly protein TadB
MDLGLSTLVIGGVIGLALGLFGVKLLVTGRAPTPTQRAFRTARDAGFYHLLFGVALLILVIGTKVKGPTAAASGVIAVMLVAVAVARFRPRGRRAAEEKAAEQTDAVVEAAGETAKEKQE